MEHIKFGAKLCQCGVNIAVQMQMCQKCELSAANLKIKELEAALKKSEHLHVAAIERFEQAEAKLKDAEEVINRIFVNFPHDSKNDFVAYASAYLAKHEWRK